MVYNTFIDDSKDQKAKEFLVSAGFVGTIEQWRPLRMAWYSELKKHGMSYFKSVEYKMLTKQFGQFRKFPEPQGREEAIKVREALRYKLLSNEGIQGIGVGVAIDDYNQVVARPEANCVLVGSPYHRALELVFKQAVQFVRSQGRNNVVAFIHDDGPDFDVLRKKNPKLAKHMGGFQSLDDKVHPPLQVADMMANYGLELGIKWLSSGRSPVLLEQMEQNIHHFKVWEKKSLLSLLKHQLKRKRKPIPADLQGDEY
jgi:hypothetical protein